MSHEGEARLAAVAIREQYDAHRARFRELTLRARERFEARDWAGSQADATERLAVYKTHLDRALADVLRLLGTRRREVALWRAMREQYAALVEGRDDGELARTFFNSVSRRSLGTVGVERSAEFLASDAVGGEASFAGPTAVHVAYEAGGSTREMVRRILAAFTWSSARYRDLDRDAGRVATVLDAHLHRLGSPGALDGADILPALFYRNKGAYIVGRLRVDDDFIPLVLPLLHGEQGIEVDAVLLTSDEASVVFGFSWSYFRADVEHPRAVVEFLRTIMPLKRVDELFTAIGFNRHGKTELFRNLMAHLEAPDARFDFAEGDEGLVMAVFTLPSFNVVFKVIKDSFGPPKRTTRRSVMERYHFVFVRDRVGRLADAQEFESLELHRGCFSRQLLDYLLRVAGESVQLDDEHVVVRHSYTERRVTPLNVYVREAGLDAAREAIVDYGNAIKDLAAANIFTGDLLIKNFGVSRHGRVIFYDYDELALLTDCEFRTLPPPRDLDDELGAEPWFHVGEHDIFPEEFAPFLLPPGPLRDAFLDAHADLLDPRYWREIQERVRAGEMVDVFPYPKERRFGA